MADVFLSYASRSVELALEVAAALEGRGFSVWWDRHLLSGERFQQAIQRELQAASAVLVLWTRDSVESEWVYSEARRGHQRGALLQVRAADITIDDLPAPFDALHCPVADDTDALLRAVAVLTGRGSSPANGPQAIAGPAHQERKVVSALAAELEPDDDVDPEDYGALAGRFETLVRSSVERFGGRLEPGSDTSLTAIFGAPHAHEDDPARAVRAAMVLLDGVAGLGGRGSRVGVATGPALVTGTSVSGRVVPAARRLRAGAPAGTVLVDADTRAAAAAVVEFDGRGDGWVVLGARDDDASRPDHEPPIVGREDELAQLQRSMTRCARESAVQLVTVVSEPGLGKSRLVRAFGAWIADECGPDTLLVGTCPPYGASVAQAALAEIVKTRTGILDSDADEVALQQLNACVSELVVGSSDADLAPWLVSRLSPLVGLPTAEAPTPELHQAWARFFELLAGEAPLVLVVEDLHWADSSTLDFLGRLLEWTVGVPLLLLVTTRPELYDRAPAWGSGARNATTLNLAPLSEHDTNDLMASLPNAASLSDELRRTVLSFSAGNPLYAREYLAMLDAAPDAEVAAPPATLQALVAARLDTLSRDAKRALQAAAVLGHTFWAGAIGHLTAAGGPVVEEWIRELTRREFVRRSRLSRIAGESEYVVSHALVADVAYSELARADRGRFHEAAGHWLAEPVGEATRSGDPALVAHHFTEALRWSPAETDPPARARLSRLAADWHTRTAEQAARSDPALALEHADTALALTPDDDRERARRLLVKGGAESHRGREEAALAAYTEAQAVAERQAQPVAAACAQTRACVELRALFRTEEATTAASGAVDALEALPPGVELVEAYLNLAGDREAAGLRQEAVRLAEQAVELMATLPDLPAELEVRALQQGGHLALWTGDSRARDHLTRALALAEKLQLSRPLSILQDELATLEFFTRSVRASLTYSEAAVLASERSGLWAAYLVNVANHVEGLLMAGRVTEALAWCHEASSRLSSVDDGESSVNFQLFRSWALRLGGDETGARDLSAAMYDLARGGSPQFLSALVLFTVEAHGPGAARHRELFEDFVEVASRPEVLESLVQYLPRAARVVVAAGEPAHLVIIEELVARTPTQMPYYRHNLGSARAELAEARGDFAGAAVLHARAAAAWAEYECPLEEAYARLGEARCRTGLGEPGAESATRALDLFRDMGATGLVTTARQLLG